MKSSVLAENIANGSGGHGLKKETLEKIFQGHDSVLDDLCYTLKKLIESNGSDFLSTQPLQIQRPSFSNFTVWHHIDEQWNESWGFEKKDAGCYVYGLYPNGAPAGSADFLDSGVIYIGESRATTRNCMLGRRTDFKGTVRNERLSPYGCGTAFKNNFGKDQINHAYQAYLPMHSSLVKETEMDLLAAYYLKYNRIPVCNPDSDLRRVQLKLGIS